MPSIDRGDLDLAVLQPVEESTDRVVVLRDVAVERHRRVRDDLSHVVPLLDEKRAISADP